MNRYDVYISMSSEEHNELHAKVIKGNYEFSSKHHAFTQGANNIRYMFKDIVDTFKPYKTSYQRTRDILQVFSGFANTLLGVVVLVFTAFYSLVGLPALMFKKANGDLNGSVLGSYFFNLAGFIILGGGALLRGVTQVATAPLALLRIPLRLIITRYKGTPLIENNKGLHKLAVLASRTGQSISTRSIIERTLAHKCLKALSQGQTTNIGEIAACRTTGFVNIKHFLKPRGASVAPAAVNGVSNISHVRTRRYI